MTKKNSGLAKTKVIRIHADDKQKLKIIKSELKMHKSHNEGDVVKQLIEMYNSIKLGETPFVVQNGRAKMTLNEVQTTLDEYKTLYEDQLASNQTLVKVATYASEKLGFTYPELIEIVKHKRV